MRPYARRKLPAVKGKCRELRTPVRPTREEALVDATLLAAAGSYSEALLAVGKLRTTTRDGVHTLPGGRVGGGPARNASAASSTPPPPQDQKESRTGKIRAGGQEFEQFSVRPAALPSGAWRKAGGRARPAAPHSKSRFGRRRRARRRREFRRRPRPHAEVARRGESGAHGARAGAPCQRARRPNEHRSGRNAP